jgi:glycosyltransferase involved in cell wall biosynthesis
VHLEVGSVRILIVLDAILPGGAETFALRMANALTAVGHEVAVFVLTGNLLDMQLVNRWAKRVEIAGATITGRRLLTKLDGLSFRLGLPGEIIRSLVTESLNKFADSWRPDIVHSHLYTTDLVVSKSQLCCPHVLTLHGDYAQIEQLKSYRTARIQSVFDTIRFILGHAAAVVCITEDQIRQMKRLSRVCNPSLRVLKIWNGCPTDTGEMQVAG